MGRIKFDLVCSPTSAFKQYKGTVTYVEINAKFYEGIWLASSKLRRGISIVRIDCHFDGQLKMINFHIDFS